MTKSTTELKPCPFCGAEAEIAQSLSSGDGNEYVVECSSCDALIPYSVTEEEAIVAWNRRSAAHGEQSKAAPKWSADEICAACVITGLGILEANSLIVTLKGAASQACSAEQSERAGREVEKNVPKTRMDAGFMPGAEQSEQELFIELRESLRWALNRIETAQLGQGELFAKADDVLARADAVESETDTDGVEVGCSNCGWAGKLAETRAVVPLGHPIAHHECPKCGKPCTISHITLEPLPCDAERRAFDKWLSETSGFDEHDEAIAWAAWQDRAALASAPSVPEGFVIVPKEPTDDWFAEIARRMSRWAGPNSMPLDWYLTDVQRFHRAMIAAIPSAEQQQGGD